MNGRPLWQCEPGTLPHDWAGMAVAAAEQAVALYRRTQNGAHMLEAWRLIRLVDDPPPKLADEVMRFFDAAALAALEGSAADRAFGLAARWNRGGARGEGTRATKGARDDVALLVRYYHLIALAERFNPPANKTAIRKRLADEFGTTQGTIKQRLIRLEGRGAKRSGRR